MSNKAGVQWDNIGWTENIRKMDMLANGKSIESVVRRICLAASVYMIWQEMNNRFFRS